MFEDMTYENILESLLKSVPSDVDKREGSIIFDALSPVALELANTYIGLDIILNNAFADTAEREYLILRAKERGIEPKEATRAVLKGQFNVAVETGARFALGELIYVVTELINDTEHTYKVECETTGTVGNKQFGDLLPLQTINGLESAKLIELLVPGEDLEDTETFRQRYFEEINNDAFGGNRADYISKVRAIDGVGQVKVYRAPEGGGTVNVIITDSENNVPTSELVETVKETLDPVKYEGLGYGIAPVGHIVSVESAYRRGVDVSAQWQTESGINIDMASVVSVIKEYLNEVNSLWQDKNGLKIYAAHIIARILDIDGIIDVTSVTFNGGLQKIEAESNEIFVFNTLNE